MVDTIPEWAIHKAAQVWCEPENAKTEMNPDLCIAFARALAAVEAETAERVERETVDLCRLALRAEYDNGRLSWECMSVPVKFLGALPTKYGKAKT